MKNSGILIYAVSIKCIVKKNGLIVRNLAFGNNVTNLLSVGLEICLVCTRGNCAVEFGNRYRSVAIRQRAVCCKAYVRHTVGKSFLEVCVNCRLSYLNATEEEAVVLSVPLKLHCECVAAVFIYNRRLVGICNSVAGVVSIVDKVARHRVSCITGLEGCARLIVIRRVGDMILQHSPLAVEYILVYGVFSRSANLCLGSITSEKVEEAVTVHTGRVALRKVGTVPDAEAVPPVVALSELVNDNRHGNAALEVLGLLCHDIESLCRTKLAARFT